VAGPAPRILVLRRGEGAGGEHPAPWESLGPETRGSRIDFVRYQIPPATVLGPSAAHASGTIEHVHVAAGMHCLAVMDILGGGCGGRCSDPLTGQNNPARVGERLS
jgi:hypothetical protein